MAFPGNAGWPKDRRPEILLGWLPYNFQCFFNLLELAFKETWLLISTWCSDLFKGLLENLRTTELWQEWIFVHIFVKWDTVQYLCCSAGGCNKIIESRHVAKAAEFRTGVYSIRTLWTAKAEFLKQRHDEQKELHMSQRLAHTRTFTYRDTMKKRFIHGHNLDNRQLC